MVKKMTRFIALTLIGFLTAVPATYASPFGAGWGLAPEASSLTFTSTKNEDFTEISSFGTLNGGIDADGTARVSVVLDSVDTGIEIRDARMRALLFESFRLPLAEITAQLDPAALADLAQQSGKELRLPIDLTLNETTVTMEAVVRVAMITDQIVSVSSAEPVALALSDFGLLSGLKKLQEAAGVAILPRTDVSFDLLFRTAAQPNRSVEAQVSMGACIKRIKTIGASDQVYFTSGSAELEEKSFPLLNAVADTIRQCPGLVVDIEGHTDDRGPAEMNLDLSDRRALAVVTYLTRAGIVADRLSATGYGEARPIADNTTKRGRWRNRRIEFVAKGS